MSEIQQWGEPAQQQSEAAWQPLPKVERRVAGVLVEKAKTTPDSYPLSLNALTNGCNQKSNRSPQMNLDADDVEIAIENLRQKGAVGVIQGSGRVVKYRHYMKEWLAVDGEALAVVTELLLRGPQTIGELRGRAARMAKIPDLSALRPILQSLIAKNLVVELTPEGRGQVITHGLYPEAELERVRHEHGNAQSIASIPSVATQATTPQPVDPSTAKPTSLPGLSNPSTSVPTTETPSVTDSEILNLRKEMELLRQDVSRLSSEIEDLWTNLGGKDR